MYDKLFSDFVRISANLICCASDMTDYDIIRRIAIYLIDKFYPLLVSNLDLAAVRSIPRSRSADSKAKHWWSGDLNEAKDRSIESHRIWIETGKPRSGPIFELFKKDKYYYKFAIKQARSDAANNISNDLHDALLLKDNNQFWKIWNSNMGNETSKDQTR